MKIEAVLVFEESNVRAAVATVFSMLEESHTDPVEVSIREVTP